MSGMPLVQALWLFTALVALIALIQARFLHAFLAIVAIAGCVLGSASQTRPSASPETGWAKPSTAACRNGRPGSMPAALASPWWPRPVTSVGRRSR